MVSLPKASLVGILRLSCLALILIPPPGRADTTSDLRNFTGAPTRVVWIQDAGPTACVYSEKPTLHLMAFDTEDNKGERLLLPAIGWYAKPQLTADGQRVIFHDLTTKTVDVVNFDGTGLRQVVQNAGEFEDDATWTDPKTGIVWVYAQIIEQRNGQPVPTIRRYQLDHPEINELIWDKAPCHMLMLAGDGRAASGGTGNGGNTPQGMFTLPNGDFMARGGGCWPSMCPDNSHRMWVFTGNHRSIHFCIPTNRTGASLNFPVNFVAPGLVIQNNEEMYHPRWTNNPHYLVLDSPFSKWSWKSDEKIPMDVAAKVEIYIGKFTPDFHGIERWVQVTHNNLGDYWPNVWIKPTAAAQAELNAAAPVLAPEEKPTAPPDYHGMVYLWLTGGDPNQLTGANGTIHQCGGQFTGDARYGSYYVLDLTDGAFVPDDQTAGPLLAACRASGQFAAEAVVKPTGPAKDTESIIMAFADDPANGNFVLSEKGDQLLLRLKTDGSSGPPAAIPVCSLPRDRSSHLIVSYGDGRLAFYLNGKPVSLPVTLHGKLSNWTQQALIFGDAKNGGQNWTGLMENIGLFSREVGAPEARQRYLQYRQRVASRQPIETVIMDAKLVGRCPAADPQGIAPYRRCLSVQLYEVEKVISGPCTDAKVSVAQWSVLDGKVVPAYTKLAVGQTYRLALEKMDDHPEQQSERSINGDFDPGTSQLYYEVRTPDAPPPPLAFAAPQVGNLVIGANAPAVAGATVITDPADTDLTSSATLQLAGPGAVAGATVVNGGSGYTASPSVTFSGGGGQGAAGAAVMSVDAIDVTDLGSGYTSPPSVTLPPPDVPGGRQATAAARFDKGGGTVAGVIVTDPGSGYLKAPQVTFSGGGGTGAAADATLRLSEIVVTSGGSGYTSPPAVSLDGGDGQDAAAQAALQMKTYRFTKPSGPALFTNAGEIDQDGSAIVFDWAAAQRPTGPCGFANTGKWTLKNDSVVQLTSSTGHIDWFGFTNSNSGTLSLLDHARLGFQTFQNSGELDIGDGVVLGQADYAQVSNTLANTGRGVIRITAGTPDQPVTFGYIGAESTGLRIIENGTKDRASQAQMIIGAPNGTGSAAFTVIGGQVDLTNFAGSRLMIDSGAQLALLTNDNGSPHPFINRDAKITNGGEMLLDGNLRLQGNHGGFTGIENTGQLTVRGGAVTMERLPNSTGGGYYGLETASQILNEPGGVVQGLGQLNYVNSTDNRDGRFLKVTNLGAVAPGVPADDRTPESFGTLTLASANVYFGACTIPKPPPGSPKNPPCPPPVATTPPRPGILRVGIAGPPNAPDHFDALTISGADDYGRLFLVPGNGNTLNIVTPSGFTPHGTYRIVTAAAVIGQFDTLQYNGSTQVPYTVNYRPDGIEVVFP